MNNALFCIPLKDGTLAQYEAFVEESKTKSDDWLAMGKRYDIHSVKIWHKHIAGKDYILVMHDVGPEFEEKMTGWDTSSHPFDTWFRESMMKVYDIENAEGMEMPRMLASLS